MGRILVAGLSVLFLMAFDQIDLDALSEEDFDREIKERFQYPPPAPQPEEVADRAEGQRIDAHYFANYLDLNRAYSPETRARAEKLADQLIDRAGDFSHEEFVLAVAEIIAIADNGHSTLSSNAFKKNTPRLPIRTFLFDDGLYVLRAKPEAEALIGAHVEQIDGRPVREILNALHKYVGGRDNWRDIRLQPILESPGLLHAAGLARSPGELTLQGTLLDGTAFERTIVAEARGRAAPVTSSVQYLYSAPGGNPFRSLLTDDSAAPLYLKRFDRFFFATEPLDHEGLYIRLAYNTDTDETPIAEFLKEVEDKIAADEPTYIVLDMRMNGGGDYTTTYNFAKALPRRAKGAPIFVLTSSYTFSAAITTTAVLKEAGGDQVRIVGSPVGDRLDFWAEGGGFHLPNAFLDVYYSAGRHVYNGPCTDYDTCFWLNWRYPVLVSSLEPDLNAPWTFAAYHQGRDPALEAVNALKPWQER